MELDFEQFLGAFAQAYANAVFAILMLGFLRRGFTTGAKPFTFVDFAPVLVALVAGLVMGQIILLGTRAFNLENVDPRATAQITGLLVTALFLHVLVQKNSVRVVRLNMLVFAATIVLTAMTYSVVT